MFGPFGQPKLSGFNIRPEGNVPGFRVNPNPGVPGFNVDARIGLTRTGPFPKGVVVKFPDGSRVDIPPGSTGGASYVPAPPNYRIP